jgi:alpha-L-fucosidase 2
MIFGNPVSEKLALNESTFWSGAPSDDHENPKAAQAFKRIRDLFIQGKYPEAAPFIHELHGRELNYGTSLPVGDLILTQNGIEGEITDYRRELDLDEAIARVTFSSRGVGYRREVLASHPDGVIAIRITASRGKSINLSLAYNGGKVPCEVETKGLNTLRFEEKAFEKVHSDGKSGVTGVGLIRLIPEGGNTRTNATSLQLTDADSATILIAIDTTFGEKNPGPTTKAQIDAAQKKSWKQLRRRHVEDHQRLFRRVSLDLGGLEKSGLPTDVRLGAMKKGEKDANLDALFFQYARYLVIAGSRSDSPLPLHLQGIWNDSLAASMGWTCDYHLDINTEQNYWLTEVGNLTECGEPLFQFVERLQIPGHKTAQKVYGITNGWVCHVFSNPWGFTAPGWSDGWGLHVTGGLWISTHLWQHYEYTRDRAFLASRAYPVLKSEAEFFLSYLYPDPSTGFLSTGPSVSPERGGETGPGPVHDRALVYELFHDCIQATEILGVDPELHSRLVSALKQLPPYKIGRNGQLQEWFHHDDGGETEHRHTSHLVGLFPLSQITRRGTPELARASRRSLDLRMHHPHWEDVEWSAGNAVCYMARLGDGEEAHHQLENLITSDADLNLLTYSRGGIAGASQNIFCIDGNTSGAAGIAEMLLQSNGEEIELLPALPRGWESGQVTGLRARGGFWVDFRWKYGQVTGYQISSRTRTATRVRVNGKIVNATVRRVRSDEFEHR